MKEPKKGLSRFRKFLTRNSVQKSLIDTFKCSISTLQGKSLFEDKLIDFIFAAVPKSQMKACITSPKTSKDSVPWSQLFLIFQG